MGFSHFISPGKASDLDINLEGLNLFHKKPHVDCLKNTKKNIST